MGEQPAIRAEGLHKRFGAVPALAGVDLQAPAGRVVGRAGSERGGQDDPGADPVHAARARTPGARGWPGFDVVRQAAAVRQLIGLAGQYAAVDGYLTGRENLQHDRPPVPACAAPRPAAGPTSCWSCST